MAVNSPMDDLQEKEQLNLEELKKLCEAATPGPWSVDEVCDSSCGWPCTPNGCHDSHPSGLWDVNGPTYGEDDDQYRIAKVDDAEFIAAARTHLPLLIAEIERYQWQPIIPTLKQPITITPKAGVKVLAYWDGVVLEATRLTSGRWTPEVPFVSHENAPSHWMPLPPPPALQSGGSNAK